MIYVSLTTIPSRVKNLNKSVKSLLSQKCKPDKIFVNIPTKYKRFKEIIEKNHIPEFKDTINVILTIGIFFALKYNLK